MVSGNANPAGVRDRVFRVEYDRVGGPEVLVWREGPIAPPGEGEVRIAVHAASVNPIDGKIRSGRLPPLPLSFPAQTGRDSMGRIIALGKGVPPDWLGRRVAFLAPRGGAGTWAREVNMPVASLARVPDTVGDHAAAALPLAGLSAAAVLSAGGLPMRGGDGRGKRVLIHAAAGGVGRIAVQLARLAGAEIHATASASSEPALRALGASQVWAYDREDFSVLRDVDLVIDLMGGEVHDKSYACLKPGGTMACLNAAPVRDRSGEYGVRVVTATVAPDAGVLRALLDLAAQGRLDPGPARCLPAEDFAQAQALSDAGRLHGKLVLDFRGS